MVVLHGVKEVLEVGPQLSLRGRWPLSLDLGHAPAAGLFSAAAS